MSTSLEQAFEQVQRAAREAGALARQQEKKVKTKEEGAIDGDGGAAGRKRKRAESPRPETSASFESDGILSVLSPRSARHLIVMSAAKITLFESKTGRLYDANTMVQLPNSRLQNRFMAADPGGGYLVTNGLADTFRVMEINAGVSFGLQGVVKASTHTHTHAYIHTHAHTLA
jgi:hypothetical protein